MRSWRLSTLFGEVHLYRRRDAPPEGTRLSTNDAALRVRHWFDTHPSTLLEVHDTVNAGPARLQRGSGSERRLRVVEVLEEAFRRGELVAVHVEFKMVSIRVERIEAPALGPETTTSEEAPKDFFEAIVKDAHGKPAAGLAYKLRTPDGKWREGKTDGSGKVRVDDIDRGYCELSFNP
jgi:hypothetical protein